MVSSGVWSIALGKGVLKRRNGLPSVVATSCAVAPNARWQLASARPGGTRPACLSNADNASIVVLLLRTQLRPGGGNKPRSIRVVPRAVRMGLAIHYKEIGQSML